MATTLAGLTAAWTLIGTTPAVLQVLGQSPVFIALAASAPTSPDAPAHNIQPDDGGAPILTLGTAQVASAQSIYARTLPGSFAALVVSS